MTTVQVATATIPVMIRRHNPYAKSFDGSLSASFDRNAPPASNYPTTCLECSHTSNTTPSRPIQASNLSHPRLSVSAPCTGGTPPSDGAFDVHSDSDDHEAPSAQLPALLGGNQAVASPYHNRVYNGITAPAASASLPLDAAALSAFLNAAGCPIDTPCPAGFVFTVYNGDISQHFNVHSETVQITRGSIKYVDHHARYGQQTRFRFQLCNNYLQHKCAKLSECSYIHATVLPKPSEVHLNPFAPRRLAADRHGHGHDVPMTAQDDPSIADAYETLPKGYALRVYAPNDKGPQEPQMIPSEMIILTAGAIAAKRCSLGGDAAPGARPRHCAHYQFKRLCNLGSQCHFIHSKVPFAGHSAFASSMMGMSH